MILDKILNYTDFEKHYIWWILKKTFAR